MSEEGMADILIGKGMCGICSPLVTILKKDEEPPQKWGIIIKIGGETLFVCLNCLQTLLDKVRDLKNEHESHL